MNFSAITSKTLYIAPSLISGYFSVSKLACGTRNLLQFAFGSSSTRERIEAVAKGSISKKNIYEISLGRDDYEQRLASLKLGMRQCAESLIYGVVSYSFLNLAI